MKKLLLYLLSPLLYSQSLLAISYQEYLYLHNSNQCSNYFEHVEEKYNIPKDILRSISVAESGRWNQQAQLYVFWPWTINQAGKSYYYSSKNEAIQAVKAMLQKGLTSIDIGCMQINLHHHSDAFLNLEQAFEPKDNIEYAATFLKRNYQRTNDWYQAVAAYHSQSGTLGEEYANKVFKIHSKYSDQKLAYSYSTSDIGEIISCNTKTKTSPYQRKDNLPFAITTANNTIMPKIKVKKDSKRLKSNMIPYSINSEVN
jgi:hypothetical protein